MSTNAHVPDGHFLILSGMTKNTKIQSNTGVPCLGGLPLIGSLFNKKEKQSDKRNLLIFVKPHIVNSSEDYLKLTNKTNSSNEFLRLQSGEDLEINDL